jgi:hypothetical protein
MYGIAFLVVKKELDMGPRGVLDPHKVPIPVHKRQLYVT